MHPELFHLCGPLAINTFGLCIIIGIIIFSLCITHDAKASKIISGDKYYNSLSVAIMVALIGGRALFVLTHFNEMDSWIELLCFWQGGFSLLGGIFALLFCMPMYFKKQQIPTIAFLDRVAIYAPLLQSIARLGCFFAGCCYGVPSSLTYFSNHPTQLYSSGLLLLIFMSMYFIIQNSSTASGQLLCSYVALASSERFIVDFWRANRDYIPGISLFSIPQILAFLLIIFAMGGLLSITFLRNQNRYESV